MGKKVLVVTPKLAADYLFCSYQLYAYARLMTRNLQMFRKIVDNERMQAILEHQQKKIVNARKLAKSFAQRAKRMKFP